MEIKKREDIPENRQVRLTLAVDADTWQQSLARCYEAIKSIAPVDGEPTRANIEAKYGAEFLYQEAVNDTYPQALVEAIQREELLIAGTPTLTVEDIGPEGYTFSAVIDLYPEVTLGEYKGLRAAYPEVALSEEDTQSALEEYARAHLDVTHPERAAMGDEVVIDFEGFLDGVPFEGGKGEQRDVHVTFPKEYTPELAGKNAVFRIKVHQITRRAAPVLDDDFAKKQGFADVSALRRAVMEGAVAQKQAQAAQQFADALVQQVIDGMTVTIPDAMVENQLDGLIAQLRGQLEGQGATLEQYLEYSGTTMEQLREHAREQAATAARYELAMTEIARQEGIEITEADLEQQYEALSAQYGLSKELLRQQLPPMKLRHDLKLARARAVVVENGRKV